MAHMPPPCTQGSPRGQMDFDRCRGRGTVLRWSDCSLYLFVHAAALTYDGSLSSFFHRALIVIAVPFLCKGSQTKVFNRRQGVCDSAIAEAQPATASRFHELNSNTVKRRGSGTRGRPAAFPQLRAQEPAWCVCRYHSKDLV